MSARQAIATLTGGVTYRKGHGHHWVATPNMPLYVTDGIQRRPVFGHGANRKEAFDHLWSQCVRAVGPRWLIVDTPTGPATATRQDRYTWQLTPMATAS